jgi:hypothetical protein
MPRQIEPGNDVNVPRSNPQQHDAERRGAHTPAEIRSEIMSVEMQVPYRGKQVGRQ